MTDETPMTDTERVEAYEAEAAQLLDKVTHRGYWSGETSPEADKFVQLIVAAAVARIEAAREARIVAEVTASQLYQVHIAGLESQRRAQAADRAEFDESVRPIGG
jgi:hypothetical protein